MRGGGEAARSPREGSRAWLADQPAIRREIERDRSIKLRVRARVFLSLGPLVFMSFWGLDWLIAPELAPTFLWLRLPVLPLSFVGFALSFSDRFDSGIRVFSAAGICWGAFAVSIIAAMTGGFEATYITGVVLIQIVPLFLPFRPWAILLLEVAIVAGHVAINLAFHPADGSMLEPVLFLLAASVLVLAVAVLSEQARIQEGVHRYRLAEANEELEQLAGLDALTGLANRRSFDSALLREWRRLSRSKHPLCVVICDVDHFKDYNDHYGHPAGDACLRKVAQLIRESLHRPSDVAARYGGEEFAVLLPEVDIAGGVAVAERIRDAVESRSLRHETAARGVVTLSLGVAALIPDSTHSQAKLVESADRALYAAKDRGRNRVESAAAGRGRRLALIQS